MAKKIKSKSNAKPKNMKKSSSKLTRRELLKTLTAGAAVGGLVPIAAMKSKGQAINDGI